jgi:hypothetical protein
MSTALAPNNNDPPLPSPLSYDDGDVILRAGNTDFRVHIWLLSFASPFFKTMFSLPRSGVKDPILIIPMHEEAASIDFILRCIYPVKRPVIASIEEATKLLDVADKLDVECVLGSVRDSLIRLLAVEQDPLRSWAIAICYDLKEARAAAAKRFTDQRAGSRRYSRYFRSQAAPAELVHVNALQFYGLLHGVGMS